MKVSVKFYAHLRDLVDKKQKIDLDLEDSATVGQLVQKLILDSKIKEHLVDEKNELRSEITILRNGREIKFLEGLDTVLNHEDEISIFPIVAGG